MNRDELARHLYINDPADPEATQKMRESFATEWDEGMASDADRADCYAKADQMIAEETR